MSTRTAEINASTTAAAAAAGPTSVTLPIPADQLGALTGVEVTAGPGSTAGVVVDVTITGVIGGTLTYKFAHHLVAEGGPEPLILKFVPPLRAAAVGTDFVVAVTGGANTGALAIAAHATSE